MPNNIVSKLPPITGELKPFRGLSVDTLSTYGCYLGPKGIIVMPYGGNTYKARAIDSKQFFSSRGTKEVPLFGMDKFPKGGKTITVFEGELDAMSYYEMTGYPAVSVQSINSSLRDCRDAYDYLMSYDNIKISFDSDSIGQQYSSQVLRLFPQYRVSEVPVLDGYKDCNDFLVAGKTKEYLRLWWSAKPKRPDSVISYNEDIKKILSQESKPPIATYPWPSMDCKLSSIRSGELVVVTAETSVGKALATDTPIPVAAGGYKYMGHLVVGDMVLGTDGKATRVVAATDTMYGHDCYRVSFRSGWSVVADADHRWLVSHNGKNTPVVKTTRELLDEANLTRWKLPHVHKVETWGSTGGSIDPYLLGLWLGDGHSYSANVYLENSFYETFDKDMFEHDEAQAGCHCVRFKDLKHGQLRVAGLLKNKHIPTAYLYADEHTRREVLRGLMDTDRSHCGKFFYSTNKRLINGVRILFKSLGVFTTLTHKRAKLYGKDCGDSWTVCVQGTTTTRIDREHITSIEPVPSVPVRCIQVDNEDHVYLCGEGMVPTHNTEVVRTIEHHVLKTTDLSVGIMHLEESADRVIRGLVGNELKKPVHLPNRCTVSIEDQMKAWYDVVGKGVDGSTNDERVYIYNVYGGDDVEQVVDTIRYLVVGGGCKIVVLDHISMLVSGSAEGDERRTLDALSTQLSILTKELDFTMFLVSHVNDDGRTRGSRNIEKVADTIIHISRDLQAELSVVRNVTHTMIKKNRYSGDTGPCGSLYFDKDTYVLTEKTNEELDEMITKEEMSTTKGLFDVE